MKLASTLAVCALSIEDPAPAPAAAAAAPGDASRVDEFLQDRPIGRLLSERLGLDPGVVERILGVQRDRGLRFGEAAVTMGVANAEDVLQALSQQFHYPVAGVGRRGDNPELVTLNEPFSERAEAFRALRSQLGLRSFGAASARAPGPQGVWAVVSPDSGDGRSYCAANLAVALAQRGDKTLLVDADLRQPRQHSIFGVDGAGGLSSVLAGRGSARAVRPVPPLPGLSLVPSGAVPPNPLELLERPLFGLLLQEWAADFDHVVVDTPAARYGADASVIGAQCGAALMVVRRNRARMGALRALLHSLNGSLTGLLTGSPTGSSTQFAAEQQTATRPAARIGLVYNER